MTDAERAELRKLAMAAAVEPVTWRAVKSFVDAANHVAVLSLLDEVERLQAERDALQRFKDWVHTYLDGKGIPHHPPGTHGAEGCRIGDRMDFVFAEWDRLRAALEHAAYAFHSAHLGLGECMCPAHKIAADALKAR